MEQKKIDRINALAKKMKNEGLTESEKEEQAILRKEYIGLFRRNLQGTLNTITLVDEEGNRTSLKDKRKKQDK